MALSSELRAFIKCHLCSLQHVDTLLLLYSNRQRSWTAEAVSRELRSTPQSSDDYLKLLVSSKLLKADSDGSFMYSAESECLTNLVAELSSAYTSHRMQVIEAVYAKPRVETDVFGVGLIALHFLELLDRIPTIWT